MSSLVRRFLLPAMIALWASPSMVSAEEGARPKFSFLRQHEDWSSYVPPEGASRWQRLKHLKLDGPGRRWASFGGSARFRTEAWDSFGFEGTSDSDDHFALWRFLLHGDFHLGPRFRFFVEGKGAFAEGRKLPGGIRSVDADYLDVQQAFVDWRIHKNPRSTWTLRMGRQGLLVGRQRLVSPLPWGNTLRAWDGAALHLARGAWSSEVFWTRPVVVQRNGLNSADDQRQFYGARISRRGKGIELDFYALGLEVRLPVLFNGTIGDETRYTYGGRAVFHPYRFWSLEIETALQDGHVGDQGVEAWMATLEGTRAWSDSACRPELRWGLDVASGDDRPGGRVETFNQLFPLGHAYLGYADVVGRQNVVAASVHFSANAGANIRFRVGLHKFRRQSTGDGVYNPAGGLLAGPGEEGSRDLAAELDLVMKIAPSPALSFELGVSRVQPGRFLEAADLVDDLTFVYAQLGVNF